MPKAPPSPVPVSEIPDATPARSGATEPTIRSVRSVTGLATPRERTTEPTTTRATLDSELSSARSASPVAASTRPPATTKAG